MKNANAVRRMRRVVFAHRWTYEGFLVGREWIRTNSNHPFTTLIIDYGNGY